MDIKMTISVLRYCQRVVLSGFCLWKIYLPRKTSEVGCLMSFIVMIGTQGILLNLLDNQSVIVIFFQKYLLSLLFIILLIKEITIFDMEIIRKRIQVRFLLRRYYRQNYKCKMLSLGEFCMLMQ